MIEIERLTNKLEFAIVMAKVAEAPFVALNKDEAVEIYEKLKEKAAEVEIEGGILNWWFVCGECQMQISKGDKYCRQCGRELDWSGIYLKETGAERVPDDLRSEGAEREQEPGEP